MLYKLELILGVHLVVHCPPPCPVYLQEEGEAMDEATPHFSVDKQGSGTGEQTTEIASTIAWTQPHHPVRLPAKTRRTKEGKLSLRYDLSQEAP